MASESFDRALIIHTPRPIELDRPVSRHRSDRVRGGPHTVQCIHSGSHPRCDGFISRRLRQTLARRSRSARRLPRRDPWAVHDVLAAMGVEAVRERMVIDRHRMTGGGVTAGIDFGLTLLARLRGETAAEVTQLALEYGPEPPFAGGTPETSEPEIVTMVTATGAAMDAELMKVVARIRPASRLTPEQPSETPGVVGRPLRVPPLGRATASTVAISPAASCTAVPGQDRTFEPVGRRSSRVFSGRDGFSAAASWETMGRWVIRFW